MSILARIQSQGGEVIRSDWRFKLLPGRLTPDALAWLRMRWSDVRREAWDQFDAWQERAAIMEFDGRLPRAEAEALAYAEVCGC